eukprot:scaffold34083_cov23-Tisochrysis_lutea.AAC.1
MDFMGAVHTQKAACDGTFPNETHVWDGKWLQKIKAGGLLYLGQGGLASLQKEQFGHTHAFRACSPAPIIWHAQCEQQTSGVCPLAGLKVSRGACVPALFSLWPMGNTDIATMKHGCALVC